MGLLHTRTGAEDLERYVGCVGMLGGDLGRDCWGIEVWGAGGTHAALGHRDSMRPENWLALR